MVNVAMVGYKYFQQSQLEGDLVIWMPSRLEGFRDLHFCHIDIVENRSGESICKLVGTMLASNPNVLHYANYRDPYTKTQVDQEYIKEVLRNSRVPIIFTSALPDAEILAESVGISYLPTPFTPDNYVDKIKQLVQ